MYFPNLIAALCLLVMALMAIYVPTVYIRKTNAMLKQLEEIAANTRK